MKRTPWRDGLAGGAVLVLVGLGSTWPVARASAAVDGVDTSLIAFTAVPGTCTGVGLIDADGSRLRFLNAPPPPPGGFAESWFDPELSPHGTRLVFSAAPYPASSNYQTNAIGPDWVAVMNVDGTGYLNRTGIRGDFLSWKRGGVMPKEQSAGKPTTRRYTLEEREQAVRLVRQLGKELGTSQGRVQRVAD